MSFLPQSSATTTGEAPAGTDRRRRRLDPGVCPECDSADTRRVVVRTDYVLYVRCDACGALTVHQKPGVLQPGQSLDRATDGLLGSAGAILAPGSGMNSRAPATSTCLWLAVALPVAAQAPAKPTADNQAVLDHLALGAKPLKTLTPAQVRSQPSPADAVKALLTKQGKSTAPEVV